MILRAPEVVLRHPAVATMPACGVGVLPVSTWLSHGTSKCGSGLACIIRCSLLLCGQDGLGSRFGHIDKISQSLPTRGSGGASVYRIDNEVDLETSAQSGTARSVRSLVPDLIVLLASRQRTSRAGNVPAGAAGSALPVARRVRL
jgi:hypothetical protein